MALTDVNAAGVTQVVAELQSAGFTAHALELDVTIDADVRSTVDAAARLLEGLDTLVANAGILTVDRIDATTPESFRRTIEVNLVGTFLCIRHAVPAIREAGGGAIVCTASQAGIEGAPELASYCASKFGVVGLVQSLARELAEDGIRVTAVAPGLVDTPMLESLFERRAQIRGTPAEELAREALADVPIGRLATPVEVANTILFLASDLAAYVSGATLPVLGGELSG